jgi:hypothetical protein
MSKFFFKDIEDNSVWRVENVDTSDPNRLGWVKAFCVEPGDDPKAFVGQKMGIDAGQVFNRPERYDVSKEPFTTQ